MSDPDDEQEKKRLLELVDKHVNGLLEHFENVQIFVNFREGEKDQTRSLERGGGNWYSRYGQVRDWVTFTEERTRRDARPFEL